jgi:serine/threonine-protein kinase ULK2
MGNISAGVHHNYQLDTMEKISYGSFGVVYKVKQGYNQYVAMKVLQIPFKDMGDISLLSFQRELEILKSLDHPNVIKFID